MDSVRWSTRGTPIEAFLSPYELDAAREVVRRVRSDVPAELWRVLLFGSRARRTARPDSDVDLLLVFRRLPPDREPQAGMAEMIAIDVARKSGVPVTVWSVSLPDLERGCRTPMLVDALDDGVPLWPADAPPLTIRYTPDDALYCTGALLDRVCEGSAEVADAFAGGDAHAAALRIRDDVVRLCTAALLLDGVTRPRRADAVTAFVAHHGAPPHVEPVLRWTARSFGPDGRDTDAVPPPPFPPAAAARAIDALRALVSDRRRELAERLGDTER